MPTVPEDAWTFRYGRYQRRVVLVPQRLSALGFSLVSWIFTVTKDCEPLFRMLAGLVPFRNCLIDRLNAEKGKAELDSVDEEKNIVIPIGWLYMLDIEPSFLMQHGRYGDFATILGQKSAIEG